MENNFTPEQIVKAKAAKSPEELLSLAKESGLELSEEQAKVYFEKLNGSGELSDNELKNVSGGGCCGYDTCPKCGGVLVYGDHPFLGGSHRFCSVCKEIYD